MIDAWELKERQALPLDTKVNTSKARITEWYEYWDGQVYVSFSGGKDSTVLLHLVRQLYPEVPAVFVDTGLEYPEIRAFVKTVGNVVWLRPKMPFQKVLEKYGCPVVSKEAARKIHEMQLPQTDKNKRTRDLRMGLVASRSGNYKVGILPKKWRFLIDAPFKINDACCDIMKKRPLKTYEKQTGLRPITGTMASEGRYRFHAYLRNGCNAFELKRPFSTPLGFWAESDIWGYLQKYGLAYSEIYKKGYRRTGCMFCAFGLQFDGIPNRFQRMKQTHPAHYRHCMDKLGMARVLDYIGVAYE